VIAHETGHGFGLPHSSGDYGAVYDNQWDVMSDFWSNIYRGGYDLTYGTLGQHTISYHKDILGWIDPAQMFIAEVGTISHITLERIALPQTTKYLGARVLIDDSPNHFFTVEARRFAGYDSWLPGEAVIIHEVELGRGEPAHVVDIDGNGNTGDEGAMWRPGETFISSANGIAVKVDSSTSTGFVVTIRNHYTQMTAVEITGAEQGNIVDSIPFTATVSPVDATTPITYTWEATDLPPVIQIGDTVDHVEFTWEEIGTKVITVTASNAGGTVVDTQLIEIDSTVPVVSLSGPAASSVGVVNVFTATVVPTDVNQPITYTWQASGQQPVTHTTGLIDTVNYVWDDPGTQVITVTAQNIQGSTTDSYLLQVLMPPVDLEVSGPDMGDVLGSYSFTATVSPSNTTVPITYTWEATDLPPVIQIGDTVDHVEFTWEEIGTKAITVTAANAGGTVVDTHLINIGKKVPIVTLSGPSESSVGDVNVFTATVVPTDVTQPISYTWQASGQTSITHTTGLSDTVSYVWDSPGTQVITVTAMNIHGSTIDTIWLPVRMPPVNIKISGPDMGDVRDSYTFTATVNPITTTVPITYVWTADEQLTITHTAGISDTVTFNWDSPGLYQIMVLATNPAGSVVDTWSIAIYVRNFLPISLRN
jgi:hypothetical protein